MEVIYISEELEKRLDEEAERYGGVKSILLDNKRDSKIKYYVYDLDYNFVNKFFTLSDIKKHFNLERVTKANVNDLNGIKINTNGHTSFFCFHCGQIEFCPVDNKYYIFNSECTPEIREWVENKRKEYKENEEEKERELREYINTQNRVRDYIVVESDMFMKWIGKEQQYQLLMDIRRISNIKILPNKKSGLSAWLKYFGFKVKYKENEEERWKGFYISL